VSRWNLRLRAALGRQYAVVVVALVVLALVGGFATYTAHVDPGTTTEERVVATWESSGSFDHAATVSRSNPLFPVGSELRDRAAYFTPIAPEVNGTYTFDYRATDGGELTTAVDVELVTRSVLEGDGTTDSDGEGVSVLWKTTRTLGETDGERLQPGASVRVPFSFNVSAVRAARDRIETQLGGGSGEVETFVRATVDVTGTVNGEAVDTRQVHTLPVTLDRRTYRFGPASASSQQGETTRTVTVTREYGPLRSVGGPLLLLLSVGGLAWGVLARSRNRLELTAAEREWLAYREDRSEFDEWITSVTLPSEAFDRPEARASSLADLVDFAIDTDSGVVESPDGGEYYVLHDGYLYRYTAPPQPSNDPATDLDAGEGFGAGTTTDPEVDATTTGPEADATGDGSDTAWVDLDVRRSEEGNGSADASNGSRDQPAGTDSTTGED
jgi:hypothetical protein